jgi:GTP 3',8-cyclase
MLRDSFGRIIKNLRISVTDRCNFRCHYCMPEEGMLWMNRSELLSYEEITRLTGVFANLGVTKIRLTGGEPLMRKDLHILVHMLAGVDGIKDIALTTNGFSLHEQAELLSQAGLKRINISMDSLDALKFKKITRRDYLTRVLNGVERIAALGIRPVKINMVVMRGVNDDEVTEFALLARSKPYIIRFIEFMPIGNDDGWSLEKVVPSREIREKIERELKRKLFPVEYHGSQPSDRYVFDDGYGEVGFISSVSEPFCDHCNRVRITSDGKLRTCLFSHHETDLKQRMRDGISDDKLMKIIIESVWNKEEGHLINRPEFVRPVRTMSQIGG